MSIPVTYKKNEINILFIFLNRNKNCSIENFIFSYDKSLLKNFSFDKLFEDSLKISCPVSFKLNYDKFVIVLMIINPYKYDKF